MAAITMGDISREHRRSFPDRLAVIDGKGRQTWPEFDDRTNQVANLLIGLGIGAGDRVLWLAQSSASFLELLIGCAKVGAMVCPVNWRQSADELRFVIEDFSPRLVVWQDEEIGEAVCHGTCQQARTSATWLQVDGEGEGSLEHAVVAASAVDVDVDVPADAPLLVIYTAAIVDRPNGSMLTHRNLLAMGMATARITRGRPHERLPQLGSALPRRELPVRGGSRVPARRHQHLRPARRRIRGAADHRGRTGDVGLPDAADHHRDQGAEPRGATGPLQPACRPVRPRVGGRVAGGPDPVGDPAGRLRPDRGLGTRRPQRVRRTRARQLRTTRPRWSRCEWWTPKGRSARSGSRARSSSGATSCTPATGTVPSSTAGGCGTVGGTPPTSAAGSPTGPSTSSAR